MASTTSFEAEDVPPEQYLKQFESLLSRGHKLIDDVTTTLVLAGASSRNPSPQATPESAPIAKEKTAEGTVDDSAKTEKSTEEPKEAAAEGQERASSLPPNPAVDGGLENCSELHQILNKMNGLMLQVLGTLHVTRKTPVSTTLPPSGVQAPIMDAPAATSPTVRSPTGLPTLNPKILTGDAADAQTQVDTVTKVNYSKKTMDAMKFRRQNEKNLKQASFYKDMCTSLTIDLAKLLHFSGEWPQLMDPKVMDPKDQAPEHGDKGPKKKGHGGDADGADGDNIAKLSIRGLKSVHLTLTNWLELHTHGKLTTKTAALLDRFATIQAAPPMSLSFNSRPPEPKAETAEQQGVGSWFLCRNCAQDGRDLTYIPKERQFVPKLPDIRASGYGHGRGRGAGQQHSSGYGQQREGPHTSRTESRALVALAELDVDADPAHWLPKQTQSARGVDNKTQATGASRSMSPPKTGRVDTAAPMELNLPMVAQKNPPSRSKIKPKVHIGSLQDRLTTIVPTRVKHGFLNQHLPSTGLYNRVHDGTQPLDISEEKPLPDHHWTTSKSFR